MLRALSTAEVETAHKRNIELYASSSLEDRITSILMDMSIGGMGLWEETARQKAKRIVKEAEHGKR